MYTYLVETHTQLRGLAEFLMHCLQTLISMTAMYESALLQGRPGQNAAEFNTYAFIMLLVGTRHKEGPTAFFQVTIVCSCVQEILKCMSGTQCSNMEPYPLLDALAMLKAVSAYQGSD